MLNFKTVCYKYIQPTENPEDAIAKQNTCGIQDDIIDIHRAKGAFKYKGNNKLSDFECKSNCKRQPENVFGFDTGDEPDPKTKRYREQNVFANIFETDFGHISEAAPKIKRHEI